MNSFSSPQCLLASQSTDFKDGVIFCELIKSLKGDPTFAPISMSTPATAEDSLKNIALALSEIKACESIRVPENIQRLDPLDIYNSEDVMYEFLGFLKEAFLPSDQFTFHEDTKTAEEVTAKFALDEIRPEEESTKLTLNEIKPTKLTLDETKPERLPNVENKPPPLPPKPAYRKKRPVEKSKGPSMVFNEEAVYQSLIQGILIDCGIFYSFLTTTGPISTLEPLKESVIVRPKTSIRQTRRSSTRGTVTPTTKHPMSKSFYDKTPTSVQEEVEEVTLETKHKLLEWLESIRLIRSGAATIAEFPSYCRNGVLLSDLILRLEGRGTEFKGVNRTPKTSTEVTANLRKCMEHLRKYEKMSPIYLWSDKSIIEGDAEVIWGLLHDMWKFYTGKPTLCRNNKSKDSLTPSSTFNNVSPSTETPSRNNFGQSELNVPHTTRGSTSFTPVSQKRVYSNSTESKGYYSHLVNTGLPYSIEDIKALETSVIEWLSSLGIVKTIKETTLVDIEARVKDGTLICELAQVLGGTPLNVNKTPRSSVSALSNIRKGLEALRRLPNINHRYLWSEKEIYKGDRGTMLGLLEDLHKYYDGVNGNPEFTLKPYCGKVPIVIPSEKSTPRKDRKNFNRQEYKSESNRKNEEFDSMVAPVPHPYPVIDMAGNVNNTIEGDYACKRLPDILVNWVHGILDSSQKRHGMRKLTTDSFKDGVLLCHIVEGLERKKIEGIDVHPKSSAASLHNIRKALESLKGKKSIPLYYIYSDREIHNGNYETIVGLLKSMKFAYHAMLSPHNASSNVSGLSDYSAKSFRTISISPAKVDYNKGKLNNSFF